MACIVQLFKIMMASVDRELDFSARRLKRIKRAVLPMGISVGLFISAVWGLGLLRPSIEASQVRIAVVEEGRIERIIDASGIVEPEIESVISTSITTRVLKVRKKVGEPVFRGEAIVDLDTSLARLQLERAEQQLRVKQNERRLVDLELLEHGSTLRSQRRIASLELDSVRSEWERISELFKQELVSKAQLGKVHAQLRKAQIEVEHLDESVEGATLKAEAEREALQMEIEILEKEVIEAKRQLMLATTRSDRDGIITWLVSEEGGSVRAGDTIARIADLSSFRVRATVSDIHSGSLSPGLPASVSIREYRLRGIVQRILPTISEGIITVLISLEDSANALLRSNLRVDVQFVLDEKERVLRLKRGPGIKGSGSQQIFVLRNGKASRARAEFGLTTLDYLEVIGGLSKGDRVIVSDMGDYLHLEEVRVY